MKLNRRIVEQVINYCESTGEFKPVCRTTLSKQLAVHRYTILRWYRNGLDVEYKLRFNNDDQIHVTEYEEFCYIVMVALSLADHKQHVIEHQRIVDSGNRDRQSIFWLFNESGIKIPTALEHNFKDCVRSDDQEGLLTLDESYY